MNKFFITSLFLLLSVSTFSAEISVLFVKGSAYVTDESAQKRLNKGDVISEGETIETKKDSFLILKIGEHSKHKVDPETVVKVESLPYKFDNGEELEEPAQIYLKVGTIVSDIFEKSDNESAIVRTDSTTMGVRGTKFLVSKLGDNVILSVNEGTVEVQNDSQADIVEANQSIVIENDQLFTAIRPYKFQKEVDWSLKNKNLKPFKELEVVFKSEFLEKKRPWKRDQLRWKQFKEKRQIRFERYKKETKMLRKNKVLKNKDSLKNRTLLKQGPANERSNTTRARETLKKQIIDRSKIDNDVKKRIRNRRRQIKRDETKTDNLGSS